MINNLIVDIANGGIRKAGMDERITSLDENSNLAELVNSVFESSIRYIYSLHPWAFKVVRLPANLQTVRGDKIAEQGKNVYAYPSNALRILGFYIDAGHKIRDDDARVSTDKDGNSIILSRNIPLFLEYIWENTDNDRLSPWLREALELKIGIEVARAKGKDISSLVQEFTAAIAIGQESNAGESKIDKIETDEYINAR